MKALVMMLLVGIVASNPYYVALQTLTINELTTTIAFCNNQTIFIGTNSNNLKSFTFNGTNYASSSTLSITSTPILLECLPAKGHLLFGANSGNTL